MVEGELPSSLVVCSWPNPLERAQVLALLNALLTSHGWSAKWTIDPARTIVVERLASKTLDQSVKGILGVWTGQRVGRASNEGGALPSTQRLQEIKPSNRVTRLLLLAATNPVKIGNAVRALVGESTTIVAAAEPASLVLDGDEADANAVARAIDMLDRPNCGDHFAHFQPKSCDVTVLARTLEALTTDFEPHAICVDSAAQCLVLRSNEARQTDALECAQLLDRCCAGARGVLETTPSTSTWSVALVPVRACTAGEAAGILDMVLLPKVRALLKVVADSSTGRVFIAGPSTAIAKACALLSSLEVLADLAIPKESRTETLVLTIDTPDIEGLCERIRARLQATDRGEQLSIDFDIESRRIALIGTDRALQEGMRALYDESLLGNRAELVTRVTRVLFCEHDITSNTCTRLGDSSLWIAHGTALEVAQAVGCALVASLEQSMAVQEPSGRTRAAPTKARTVSVGGADLTVLVDAVTEEIAKFERRNRGRDGAVRSSQPFFLLPDPCAQALVVAGRSDLVDRAVATIASVRGLAPKHWLTRIVALSANDQDAIEEVHALSLRQLCVPQQYRVPMPSVHASESGTQAAIGGDPAQVVILERALREACDRRAIDRLSLGKADEFARRRAIAMLSLHINDAVRFEKEWKEKFVSRKQQEVRLYADPETEVLCALGPVDQLVELRTALCGEMVDRTLVTQRVSMSDSQRAADALLMLSRDEVPACDLANLPRVAQQFPKERVVTIDEVAGTLVFEVPTARRDAAVAALNALDQVLLPNMPACALFEVTRGDAERLAQNLRGLAARGLLGGGTSDAVRPTEIVVQVVPETSILLVAGLPEHLERARQSLRQSEALAAEIVALDVDASSVQADTLRNAVLQALRSKLNSKSIEAPSENRTEQATQVPTSLEAVADRARGIVHVTGTRTEVDSFRRTNEAVVRASEISVERSCFAVLHAQAEDVARVLQTVLQSPLDTGATQPAKPCAATASNSLVCVEGDATTQAVASVMLDALDNTTAALDDLDVVIVPSALPEAVADAIEVHHALKSPLSQAGPLFGLPSVAAALAATPLLAVPVVDRGCFLLAARPDEMQSWIDIARLCEPSGSSSADPAEPRQFESERLWCIRGIKRGSAVSLARILGERGPQAQLFAAADPRTNALILGGRPAEVRASLALLDRLQELLTTSPTGESQAIAEPPTTHSEHKDSNKFATQVIRSNLAALPDAVRFAERLLSLWSASSHACRMSIDESSGIVVVRGTAAEVSIVTSVLAALQQFERAPQSALCCRVVTVCGVAESAATAAHRALQTEFETRISTTMIRDSVEATKEDSFVFVVVGAPDQVAESTALLLQRLESQSAVPQKEQQVAALKSVPAMVEFSLRPLKSETADTVVSAVQQLLDERAMLPDSLQSSEGTDPAAVRMRRDPLVDVYTMTAHGVGQTAVAAVVPSVLSTLTGELVERLERLLTPETQGAESTATVPPKTSGERSVAARDLRVYPLFGRDAVSMAEAMNLESGSRDEAARVTAVPMTDAGALLLEDQAWRLDRVDAILAALDPRIARDAARIRILPLANARAARLVPVVLALISGSQKDSQQIDVRQEAFERAVVEGTRSDQVDPNTGHTTVLADTKANAIVIEATPSVLDLAEAIVRELDVATDATTGRVLRILATQSGDASALARILIDFFETDDTREQLPDIRSNAAGDALLLRANTRQFEAIRALLEKRDVKIRSTRMLQRTTIDAARGDALEMAPRVLALVHAASAVDRIARNTANPAESASANEPEGLAVACDAVANALVFLGTPEELARAERVVAQATRALPADATVRALPLSSSVEPQQLSATLVAALALLRATPQVQEDLGGRVIMAPHPSERALLVLSNAEDFATVTSLATILSRASAGETTRFDPLRVDAWAAQRSSDLIGQLATGSNVSPAFRALVGATSIDDANPARMSSVSLEEQGIVLVCGAVGVVEPTSSALRALQGTQRGTSVEVAPSSRGAVEMPYIDVVPLRHIPVTLAVSLFGEVLARGEPTRPTNQSAAPIEAVSLANTVILRAVDEEIRRALTALDVAEAKGATHARVLSVEHGSVERVVQELALDAVGEARGETIRETQRCIAASIPSKHLVLLVGSAQSLDAAEARVKALDVPPSPAEPAADEATTESKSVPTAEEAERIDSMPDSTADSVPNPALTTS